MKRLITKALLVCGFSAFTATSAFATTLTAAKQCNVPQWQDWQTFKAHFVTDKGRVIDKNSTRLISTSEGQSYALFFALVANDKAAFDRILDWTEEHLSEGDLSTRLPAWQWGKADDGNWQILDHNPASDSDLWITYALIEAHRLWGDRRYDVLAYVMAKRIFREETMFFPSLGQTLLPAPYGFEINEKTAKLNPSYVPPFIFSRLATKYPNGPWQQLHQSSMQVLTETAPNGFAPDWVLYSETQGFHFGKRAKNTGSYDAIRTYLWAGLLADESRDKTKLVMQYAPMVDLVERLGYVPEVIDTSREDSPRRRFNRGPIGFNAALLPLLQDTNQDSLVARFTQRVSMSKASELENNYYNSVLILFALGFMQGHYHIDVNGQLQTTWSDECA